MNFKEATDPKGPVPFLQEKRILLTAALVLLADQLTTLIVIGTIEPPNRETRFPGEEIIIIEGFLKFLHWQNSGGMEHNGGKEYDSCGDIRNRPMAAYLF